MTYRLLQAGTQKEMVDRLNGTIQAPGPLEAYIPAPTANPPVREPQFDLNGLTLVFTTPAVTVTFNDQANPYSVQEMLTELVADVQAVDSAFEARVVLMDEYSQGSPPRVRLEMWTGTAAGLVLNLATSTAAALLGFPTTGTLSEAPIVSSTIVAAGDTISGGVYIIYEA